ncbi:MAG: serine hydrolase [Planctomycetota bacterium]
MLRKRLASLLITRLSVAVALWILGLTTPAIASSGKTFAYYDVDLHTHRQFENLVQGSDWRLTSLSAYGPIDDTRYAAIWKDEDGPEWHAEYALDDTDFSWAALAMQGKGFRLKVVTVTGAPGHERYSGVFVKDGVTTEPLLEMTQTTFDSRLEWARDNGYRPAWISSYQGDVSLGAFYAAVFVKDSVPLAWNVSTEMIAGEYQEIFDATRMGWGRPHLTVMRGQKGGGVRYASIFVDDQIGPYFTYHHLTPAEYESHKASLKKRGLEPIRLEGVIEGNGGTLLTATFAASETPIARQLTVTGQSIPGLEKFDDLVIQRLKARGARAATIAVAQGGEMKMAKAFTWAEPGYPIAQPTDVTRIASCSKIVASLALHDRYQLGLAAPQDLLVPTAALSPLTTHPDWMATRIQQLITHTGGSAWNPYDADVAAAYAIPFPITRDQAIAYRISHALDYTPGTKSVYSNFGYALISRVVDQVSPGSFNDVVQQRIYDRLGLTRPRPARSLLSQKYADELRYHSWRLAVQPSVLSPDQPWLPGPYATNIERQDASGGVLIAAPDFVKILASLDRGKQSLLSPTWRDHFFSRLELKDSHLSNGGMSITELDSGELSFSKGGAATVTSVIIHRTDDIDIAVFFNSVGVPSVSSLNEIASDVTSWSPGTDFFWTFGIPPF